MRNVLAVRLGVMGSQVSPCASTGEGVGSCRSYRGVNEFRQRSLGQKLGVFCELSPRSRVNYMSERLELPQGTLDLLILKTLGLGPQHGWAISERVQQISSDVLRIQQGSLYPALHRLQRRGWIAGSWGTSENNRRAKYYELTAAGRRQLEVEERSWRKLAAAMGQVLEAI